MPYGLEGQGLRLWWQPSAGASLRCPQEVVVMSFNQDIVARARANGWFREVLSTGPHCQVVVMSIPVGGDIGEEVHDTVDQVLVCVDGAGLRGARWRAESGASRLPGPCARGHPAQPREQWCGPISSSTRSTRRPSTPSAPSTAPRPRRMPARSTTERVRDLVRTCGESGPRATGRSLPGAWSPALAS